MARGVSCPHCGHNAFRIGEGNKLECLNCSSVFEMWAQFDPGGLDGDFERLREELRRVQQQMESWHIKLSLLQQKLSGQIDQPPPNLPEPSKQA